MAISFPFERNLFTFLSMLVNIRMWGMLLKFAITKAARVTYCIFSIVH